MTLMLSAMPVFCALHIVDIARVMLGLSVV